MASGRRSIGAGRCRPVAQTINQKEGVMTARTTPWLMRPSLLRTFLSHVRLAVRLLREPQVGWLAKIVPLLAVLYVLSPLDLVPDVIPVIGEIDDLGMVFL